MQLKPVLIIIFLFVAFSSCSHVYAPALFHQDIAYQPKPASFDTAKSATYVSLGWNNYTSPEYEDLLESAQMNISRGHDFKNFNLAYGAFGVLGNYNNSTSGNSATNNPPNNFSDKFFGAYGGRISADAYVTSGRVDFRFIGFEAAYSHEFGSYAAFRRAAVNSPDYDVDPRTNLFTIGLTTEVIFHNVGDNGFENGIRGFLGTTVGYSDLSNNYNRNASALNSVFPKVSYFIKYKKYFGTIEAGSNILVRFGFVF